jgi:predicted GNAT family N-acyltransferase
MELKNGPSHNNEQYLWIYLNEKCTGYLKIVLRNTTILEINQIYIYSQFRGNNYGKQAIKLLIDQKQKSDLHKIVLWAYGEMGNENKLYEYYEDIGFSKVGKTSVTSVDGLDYLKQYMEYVLPV